MYLFLFVGRILELFQYFKQLINTHSTVIYSLEECISSFINIFGRLFNREVNWIWGRGREGGREWGREGEIKTVCRFTIYTQVHVSLYVSFDLKGHSVTSFSQYMLTIIIVLQVLMYLELVVMIVHTLPASSLLQMSYQNLLLPLPLQEVMREYLVQTDPKQTTCKS